MSDQIMKALDAVDAKITKMAEVADAEVKALGKVSADTKTALENIGIEQRTLADRLLQIEQKGVADSGEPADESYGTQFVKSASYESLVKNGAKGRANVELKNTVTNTIGLTYSERRPAISRSSAVSLQHDARCSAV